MDALLTFRLLTPNGVLTEFECDSVNFFAKDNKNGEGGGSIGIRPGHARTVIALANGLPLKVSFKTKVLFTATVNGGYAEVKDNIVTVLTESINK